MPLLPPYAFSAAASKTRCDAFQMSRPVPSPSMNGMMGWSGTVNCPSLYSIGSPVFGSASPLYVLCMILREVPSEISPDLTSPKLIGPNLRLPSAIQQWQCQTAEVGAG